MSEPDEMRFRPLEVLEADTSDEGTRAFVDWFNRSVTGSFHVGDVVRAILKSRGDHPDGELFGLKLYSVEEMPDGFALLADPEDPDGAIWLRL